MEQSSQTLRSLLIPLQEEHAVLPNGTVAEILPFSTPMAMDNAPPWVVGEWLWRAQVIPLVSLERLAFNIPPQPSARSRIIVIKALGGDPRLLHFAILAASAPRLINLTRTAIALSEAGETTVPKVLSRIRVDDWVGIIPDIEAIEAELTTIQGPNISVFANSASNAARVAMGAEH